MHRSGIPCRSTRAGCPRGRGVSSTALPMSNSRRRAVLRQREPGRLLNAGSGVTRATSARLPPRDDVAPRPQGALHRNRKAAPESLARRAQGFIGERGIAEKSVQERPELGAQPYRKRSAPSRTRPARTRSRTFASSEPASAAALIINQVPHLPSLHDSFRSFPILPANARPSPS